MKKGVEDLMLASEFLCTLRALVKHNRQHGCCEGSSDGNHDSDCPWPAAHDIVDALSNEGIPWRDQATLAGNWRWRNRRELPRKKAT